MRLIKTILLFISFLFMNLAYGVEVNDSLLSIINSSAADSVKVRAYDQLAVNARVNKQYAQSLGYYQASFSLSMKLQDTSGMILNLYETGVLYSEANMLVQAVQYLTRSLDLATSSSDIAAQVRCYKMLSKLYERAGNHSSAFRYYKLADELSDSLLKSDYSSRVLELRTQLEEQKSTSDSLLTIRRSESERLKTVVEENKRNRFNLLIVLLLAGVALLVTLLLLIRASRKTKEVVTGPEAVSDVVLEPLPEKHEPMVVVVAEEIDKTGQLLATETEKGIPTVHLQVLHPDKEELGSLKKEFFIIHDPEVGDHSFCYYANVGSTLVFALVYARENGILPLTDALHARLTLETQVLRKQVRAVSALQEVLENKLTENCKIDLISLEGENGKLNFSGEPSTLLIMRKGEKEVMEVEEARIELSLNSGDTFYLFYSRHQEAIRNVLKDSIRTIRLLKPKEQEKFLSDSLQKWSATNKVVPGLVMMGVKI